VSSDGSKVVFATDDRLLPQDRDKHCSDVYALLDGRKTILLTPDIGTPAGWPSTSTLNGLSRDGSRVLIHSYNRYSPSDLDPPHYPGDSYLLEAGEWKLVTVGGVSMLDGVVGMTDDARRIYFVTETGLASNDSDADVDLYEWNDGSVRMVSTGPNETIEPQPSHFSFGLSLGGATADGNEVFFAYEDDLTPEAAASGLSPLYVRKNGAATEWIPLPGSLPEPWSPNSEFGGISQDGSTQYIDTNLRIDPGDTDLTSDVYSRSAGGLTLTSRGAQPANGTGPECSGEVHTSCSATFLAASASGYRVFFETDERLTPEDTDNSYDIYERSGGVTTLISPKTPDVPKPASYIHRPLFEGLSADGSQVAFSTRAQLVPSDDDKRLDVYVNADGRIHLVSTGPADRDSKYEPRFADFTESGDNVIFWTRAPLVPADADDQIDIYQRIDFNTAPESAAASGKKGKAFGKTRLISTERISTKVGIGGKGRTRRGRAQVRVICPKKEESGCRGTAKVRGAGKGGFKLKRGRKAWVSVGSAMAVGGSATVVVRARDGVGNRSRSRRAVRF
jgi:hypothetical protein